MSATPVQTTPVQTTTAEPTTAAITFPIPSGTIIEPDKKYYSASGNHYFIQHSNDNNLGLNKADGTYGGWSLDLVLPKEFGLASKVEMLSDSNFVIYKSDGSFLWSALTQIPPDDPPVQLVLTSTGALQLVSGGLNVLWSSDGNLTTKPAWSDLGWPTKHREITSPKITILGSRAVSEAAMDVVKKIYTDITSRLKQPAYLLSKFDGYVIYITNGEDWSELSKLAPIGTMWSGTLNNIDKGDDLRGGTNLNYLWIDEQMICKTGVVTRNVSHTAGKRSIADNYVRTFDQVIHEFGHAIAYRYGLANKITELYRGDDEVYAWSIQHWFGSPEGTDTVEQQNFLGEIFNSKTTFSTDLYKPPTK